ncbi:MAG: UpxY family transcription antiterminator [Bacteroidetes bacterium]|nr:UpxY family transcription antiterminator [Bacteroidota bacterium]MBS1608869.1 UpxY family transcription antiterminator [Bacteroidota bacterium]
MIDRKWHAVYTKPNKEKKVASLLIKKKIAAYIPVYDTECIIEGRKKVVEKPVFPGYVFIAMDKEENVLQLSGDIINFVYWKANPATIQNSEINALKLFLNEYSCTRLEKAPVSPNEQFKIDNELQVRRKGNFVEANVATVKLTIPSLGRVLVAEIRKEKMEEFMYAKGTIFKNITGS